MYGRFDVCIGDVLGYVGEGVVYGVELVLSHT